ncbi:hypothetical protein EYF80_056437 [Liparis tanakae]|uniref:Uncharacterized protein n=1 Tax=Liparis tanakae TaxID=230148 RepID=A0A4Z2EXC5_9TELE|nr:hypothetical protein EYF80_056437 [Liparis tanakae]
MEAPGGDTMEAPRGDTMEAPGGDTMEAPGGDTMEAPGSGVPDPMKRCVHHVHRVPDPMKRRVHRVPDPMKRRVHRVPDPMKRRVHRVHRVPDPMKRRVHCVPDPMKRRAPWWWSTVLVLDQPWPTQESSTRTRLGPEAGPGFTWRSPGSSRCRGCGREDAPQRRDARLVLEGPVLRHRAVEVALDLLGGQRAQPHGLLHQVAIVTGVGRHLILCSWTQRGTCEY